MPVERDDDGFVVEQPVDSITKDHAVIRGTGTARVYVGTEARAKEIVEQGASATPPVIRTYRRIPLAEMPEHARVNLLAARGA